MLCSVCIATYKRPQLLEKLLKSILNQKLFEEISLQVIIVDNDINLSARDLVKKFSSTNKISFEYHSQSIKNISLTRNVAVKSSKGVYLLFIDDDGYADQNWVNNMVNCIEHYQADGVFGAVIPYFENGVPNWIKKSHLFNRPIPQTGSIATQTRTGNCIIKGEMIKSIEGPFNPKFGLTGGEDVNLFGLLARKGAKFLSCSESIVYDFIPKERATIKWLFKRSFRTGISSTERKISFSKSKFVSKIYLLTKAILYSIISLLLLLIFYPLKIWRVHWWMKLAGNLGHIFGTFEYRYEEYK